MMHTKITINAKIIGRDKPELQILLCIQLPFYALFTFNSTEFYVMTISWNRLDETIPTNGHTIESVEKIRNYRQRVARATNCIMYSVTFFCIIYFHLNRILCCDHSLESSR